MMQNLLVSESSAKELSHLTTLFSDIEFWDLGLQLHVPQLHVPELHDDNFNWLESYFDGPIPEGPPARDDQFQSFPAPVVSTSGFAPILHSHEFVEPYAYDLGDVLETHAHNYRPVDPLEADRIRSIPGPVNTNSASALLLNTNVQECTPRDCCIHIEDTYSDLYLPEVRVRTEQLVRSFSDENIRYDSAPREVEKIIRALEHINIEHGMPACNICLGAPINPVAIICGHLFCPPCLTGRLLDQAKSCPACRSFELRKDVNIIGDYDEDLGTVHDYAPVLLVKPHDYALASAAAQDCSAASDIVQHAVHETEHFVDQFVPDLTLKYQPVQQKASYGDRSDHVHGSAGLLNGVVPEAGSVFVRGALYSNPAGAACPSISQQLAKKPSRKRGPETLCVDHNGVAARNDGVEERFTAYYRPSYWTEDDSAVFLGEYPTQEEAKDAYNLVALLHEGPDAQIDLTPFTPDRYAAELLRWKGKPQVDLVCELRLRGRGLLKDNTINYKHVGRRWSGKKKGLRYFSTVSDDPVLSAGLKNGKPKRSSLTTFETPEEAALAADQILVKRKGNEAWTNFPLSSYIPKNDLPLFYLPLSNNFRDNLTFKRSRERS